MIFCLWPVFSKPDLFYAAWTLIPRLCGITDWDFHADLLRLSIQLDTILLGRAPFYHRHPAYRPSTWLF